MGLDKGGGLGNVEYGKSVDNESKVNKAWFSASSLNVSSNVNKKKLLRLTKSIVKSSGVYNLPNGVQSNKQQNHWNSQFPSIYSKEVQLPISNLQTISRRTIKVNPNKALNISPRKVSDQPIINQRLI